MNQYLKNVVERGAYAFPSIVCSQYFCTGFIGDIPAVTNEGTHARQWPTASPPGMHPQPRHPFSTLRV
jgi:hypothetical protein